MLVDVLGKKPSTTVVVIDEVPIDNWGMGGDTHLCVPGQGGGHQALGVESRYIKFSYFLFLIIHNTYTLSIVPT